MKAPNTSQSIYGFRWARRLRDVFLKEPLLRFPLKIAIVLMCLLVQACGRSKEPLLDINPVAGQNNINAALKIGVLDIKNLEPEPIEIRRIRVNDEWDVMATAPDFNKGFEEAVPHPLQLPKQLASGESLQVFVYSSLWPNYSYNKGEIKVIRVQTSRGTFSKSAPESGSPPPP